MNFSSTLRDLREGRHVTQEELADYLGITRSAVAGYETKGKQPDFERLVLIADYFHVSLDYLLRGDDLSVLSIINNRTSPKELEILKSYFALSEEYRTDLLNYIEYLLMKNKNGDGAER